MSHTEILSRQEVCVKFRRPAKPQTDNNKQSAASSKAHPLDQLVPAQTSNRPSNQSATFLAECHTELGSVCCLAGLCLLLRSQISRGMLSAGTHLLVYPVRGFVARLHFVYKKHDRPCRSRHLSY